MKWFTRMFEAFVAAIVAAILLSHTAFAKPICKDITYLVMAGELKHTCANKFFVNGKPLKQWLRDWKKKMKKNPEKDDGRALDEVMSAVKFLSGKPSKGDK